jgi:hypothetical protein
MLSFRRVQFFENDNGCEQTQLLLVNSRFLTPWLFFRVSVDEARLWSVGGGRAS